MIQSKFHFLFINLCPPPNHSNEPVSKILHLFPRRLQGISLLGPGTILPISFYPATWCGHHVTATGSRKACEIIPLESPVSASDSLWNQILASGRACCFSLLCLVPRMDLGFLIASLSAPEIRKFECGFTEAWG